jgi:hypothetical protein
VSSSSLELLLTLSTIGSLLSSPGTDARVVVGGALGIFKPFLYAAVVCMMVSNTAVQEREGKLMKGLDKKGGSRMRQQDEATGDQLKRQVEE